MGVDLCLFRFRSYIGRGGGCGRGVWDDLSGEVRIPRGLFRLFGLLEEVAMAVVFEFPNEAVWIRIGKVRPFGGTLHYGFW
jgi:hypothetical protein